MFNTLSGATMSNEPAKSSKFQAALPYIQTSVIYLTIIFVGTSCSITSPTLLALARNIHQDVQHMGVPFTARSFGQLATSFGCAVVFDLIKNKQILLVALLFNLSITTFLLPLCQSIYTFTADLVIGSVSIAAITIRMNVMCLRIWGEDSGPFYQALFFSVGIGRFLGSTITTPFLPDHESKINDTNDSIVSRFKYKIEFRSNDTNTTDTASDSQIVYAYAIVASIGVLAMILWIISFCLPKEKEDSELSKKQVETKLPRTRFTVVVTVITALMTYLIIGMDVGFFQMLPVYATEGFGLSESESSKLSSLYLASYTVTRFLGIFFAYKLRPTTIIIGDIVLTFTGSIILVLLARRFIICLWIGSALIGIGLASLNPSVVILVDRHINVSNKVVSVFVAMGGLAQMVVPNLTVFVKTCWAALFYFMLLSSILFGLFFVLLAVLFWQHGEKYVETETLPEQNNNSKSSMQRGMQEEGPIVDCSSKEVDKANKY